MPVDLAPAPVAGEEGAAIGFGPALVVQRQRAGPASLAVGAEGRHDLVREVGEPLRVAVVGGLDQVADAHVPAGPVVGVVAREEVQIRVDRDGERVAQADGEDLQLGAVGPHAEDAAPRCESVVPSFPFAPWNP